MREEIGYGNENEDEGGAENNRDKDSQVINKDTEMMIGEKGLNWNIHIGNHLSFFARSIKTMSLIALLSGYHLSIIALML